MTCSQRCTPANPGFCRARAGGMPDRPDCLPLPRCHTISVRGRSQERTGGRLMDVTGATAIHWLFFARHTL